MVNKIDDYVDTESFRKTKYRGFKKKTILDNVEYLHKSIDDLNLRKVEVSTKNFFMVFEDHLDNESANSDCWDQNSFDVFEEQFKKVSSRKNFTKRKKADFSRRTNLCQQCSITMSDSSDISIDHQNIPYKKSSKRRLKKCRYCNFKKRTCIVDPFSCKALKLKCFKCRRSGHFPQSLNCKARKNKIKKEEEKQTGDKWSKILPDCLSTEIEYDDIKQKENITMKNNESIKIVHDNNLSCCSSKSEFSSYDSQAYNTDTSLQSSISDICQLDGLDDFSELEDIPSNSEIFGVKCEARVIVDLVNFFRSFNFLWICMKDHLLCRLEQACFFCHMRSSCLRIRQERKKGPRSLKISEFTTQLNQYGIDWRLIAVDMNDFISTTIELLIKSDDSICSKFLIKHRSGKVEGHTLLLNTDHIDTSIGIDILMENVAAELDNYSIIEDKCIIIQLSKAVTLNVESVNDQLKLKKHYHLLYKSHIQQKK